MKTKLFISLICGALSLSSAALASDMSKDLKTPFEPLSNPFNENSEKPLNAKLANDLSALLLKCTSRKVSVDEHGWEVWNLAEIKTECSEFLSVNQDQNHLTIDVQNQTFHVISWDGSHSDGGDEQAIGIYNAKGKRIAVYPALYADGNVVDGLAHALNVDVPQVRTEK
jgi:hypothetical protein